MRLISDADGLIYKAAFSAQKVIRHVNRDGKHYGSYEYYKDMVADLDSDGIWDRKLRKPTVPDIEIQEELILRPEKDAIMIIDTIVDAAIDRFQPSNLQIILSGDRNFRYDIYPEYKANRKDIEKPIHFQVVKDRLLERGAVLTDGIEADDAACISAWECLHSNEPFVVSSADKDLRQVPGTHYNPDREIMEEIDPYQADLSFYTQLLTGDTSDNIPGIRGIGPSRAKRTLAECEDELDMFDAVKEAYENNGQPYMEMERNAKLLYLLRTIDDSWRPPK